MLARVVTQPALRRSPRGSLLEHHVRGARLTDLDASIRLMRSSERSEADDGRDAGDYLRNLLFVPSATVLVAEQQRRIVAAGVLTIRPSVWSGPFVGVIDELGTAREALTTADRLTIGSSLVEHLVRSARNKGCTRVEVTEPLVSAEPALWKRAQVREPGSPARARHVGRRRGIGPSSATTTIHSSGELN